MICNRWAKAEVSVSDLKMLDGGVAAVGNTAAVFKVGLRERGEPALQLQDIFLKFQLYIAEFVAVDADRKALDLPELPVHLVFSYLLHLLMKLVYLAQHLLQAQPALRVYHACQASAEVEQLFPFGLLLNVLAVEFAYSGFVLVDELHEGLVVFRQFFSFQKFKQYLHSDVFVA